MSAVVGGVPVDELGWQHYFSRDKRPWQFRCLSSCSGAAFSLLLRLLPACHLHYISQTAILRSGTILLNFPCELASLILLQLKTLAIQASVGHRPAEHDCYYDC